MPPIYLAGEMAVWSEEKWAAFECDLQRRLRVERRRMQQAMQRRQRTRSIIKGTAAWGFVAAAVLLAFLYQ